MGPGYPPRMKSDHAQGTRGDRDDRPVIELTADLSAHLTRLVRAETRLAVAEMRRKAAMARRGGAMLGAAGLAGLIGAATLAACAVLALSLVWPPWLAALVVGGVAVVVAGALALAGRFELRRATPPIPEWAVDSVRNDIGIIKKGLRHDGTR